jgi:hypothetical protein
MMPTTIQVVKIQALSQMALHRAVQL